MTAQGQNSSLNRLISRIGRLIGRPPQPAATADGAACDGRDRIRIASYNIHKGIGNDGNYDPQRTIEVIAELDADIVALQEADQRLGNRKGRLSLSALEREAGLSLLPIAARPMSHGWHGNALLFRRASLLHAERVHLPHAEPRGAILAEFDIAGNHLRIVAAHLGLLSRTRRQQMERLRLCLEARDPMPTLLCGDFNEWRPGRANSPLERLEPMFRTDAARPSFPSRRPVFPLDRIFGWPDGIVADFSVHDSPLARRASDHLPVKAVIDLAAGMRLTSPSSSVMGGEGNARGGEILDGKTDRLEQRYLAV